MIIDGYNIINYWKDIFNLESEPLEECRYKLLNILSNYQGYKNTDIIVVFDAHLVKGSRQKHEAFDNLTVVYTKENETADNYIERFVYLLGSTCIIRVATSDGLEQKLILGKGGIRLSPRELREEIGLADKVTGKGFKSNFYKTNALMSHLKPELLKVLEKMRRDEL